MFLALHLELGKLLPEPHILRFELHGLLEPGHCLGKLPLDTQAHPDLHVAMGQFRIQAKGLEIGGSSLAPSVQPLQDVAQVVMVDRQIGLEVDSLLAVDQRFLCLAAVEQDHGESTACRSIARRRSTASRRCSSNSSCRPSSRRTIARSR